MTSSDRDPSSPTSAAVPRLRVVSSRAHTNPPPLPSDSPPAPADPTAAHRRLAEDPEILAFLRRYLRSLSFEGDELKDLVQEVILAALQSIHRYRADRGELRPWLATIAEHKAADFRRRAQPYREVSLTEAEQEKLADTGPLPDQAAITRQRKRVCDRLLNEIPRRQLEALVARDVWMFSFTEMAEELRIPYGTARSRYYAGRRALDRAIQRREAAMKRLGLDGLPILLAWLLSSGEARAAGTAARKMVLRILLGALVVAAVLAAAVGLGAHMAQAPTMARPGVELVAPAAAARAGVMAGLGAPGDARAAGAESGLAAGATSGAAPTGGAGAEARAIEATSGAGSEAGSAQPVGGAPRSGPDEEERLMMRARAAVAAGNHAGALLLLKEHMRDYPAGRCTVEREAFLRLLEQSNGRR